MKTIIFIIFFLLLGAFFIIAENQIPLNNSKNINAFFSEYGNWIGKISGNAKTTSGYLIKMKWLPELE